jgi:hypothetical protein
MGIYAGSKVGGQEIETSVKFYKIEKRNYFKAGLFSSAPQHTPIFPFLFQSDIMGKDKVEKDKKRAEKKEKRAEKDGVHKAGKKEKKDKKDKTALADAVEKEITSQVLDGLDQAASAVVQADPMVVDGERPIGALVPFANPLVEDKQAKKVLKSVKKGESCKTSISLFAG